MAMLRMIPVFVSSPEDVRLERKAVIEAVHSLDDVLMRRFGVSIAAVDWHKFAPIAQRSPTRGFQDRILEEIKPESLFVGIFGKRYGTPTGEESLSGTHTEIRFATKHRDRIKIMQYFRRVERDDKGTTIDDLSRINDVKKEFRDKNLAYQEYSNYQ